MPIRVAVIGGGAAGLCAARYLTKKPDVFQVVVYEQSDQIGGTWVYTEDVGTDKYGQPVHSSMYYRLRTNLPKEVMMFPDLPLKEGGRTSFIKHDDVLRYLKRYAATFDLHKYIQLQTRVELVKPITSNDRTTWEVTVKNAEDPDAVPQVHVFDAVMVCNGKYAVPSYPDIPGLETFTGKVIHSHEYRHPEDFQGQCRFNFSTSWATGGAKQILGTSYAVSRSTVLSSGLLYLQVQPLYRPNPSRNYHTGSQAGHAPKQRLANGTLSAKHQFYHEQQYLDESEAGLADELSCRWNLSFKPTTAEAPHMLISCSILVKYSAPTWL